MYKNTLRAKPGRKPCRKDLMKFLSKSKKQNTVR